MPVFLPRPNHRYSTTLYQAADSSQTTLYPNSVPPNVPTILILEPKTAKEEKVRVTAKTSSTITVTRGYGGTTATDHSIGAALVDYTAPEYIDEIADAFEVEHNSDGTHNIAGQVTLTGTQTLTNKTINGDNNTLTNVPAANLKIASQAQGDILYRGASAWERLPAGTSGHFLKTQGTGANPTWAEASSNAIIRLRLTANMTATNNTETAIGWDAEDEKSGITHDNSTNNSRITIATSGYYLLTTTVRFSTALGAYETYLNIFKNGTAIRICGGGASAMLNVTGTAILNLSASDYIELKAYQNSGADKTIEGGSLYYHTKLELRKI